LGTNQIAGQQPFAPWEKDVVGVKRHDPRKSNNTIKGQIKDLPAGTKVKNAKITDP